jgi:linearmycin/streptolysin S transport system permease protein
MKQLRNVWFIGLKELKIFSSDRAALIFSIIFPFFFVTLFYFLFQGVGAEDTRLKLYLTTEEPAGSISYNILSSIQTTDISTLQPGQPEIIWLQDSVDARSQIDSKKISGLLLFPADFTGNIETASPAQISIIVNPNDQNTRAALNGLAQGLASDISARELEANAAATLLAQSGQSADIPVVIGQIYSQQPPASADLVQAAIDQVGAAKAANPANWVIPGYLVMFVFFTAALSAERLVRERQNHTLERLLASSVSREALLGGVYFGTVLKGLVQIVIFWAAGILLYHLNLGPQPFAVMLLSVLVALMAAAFSLMLATLVTTARAAASIGVLASLILAPLGGCWWPLFITPKWMQNLALFTPHGWATTAFNKLMLYGGSFGDAVPGMLALVGFGLAFAILAVMRFRTSSVTSN